MKEHMEKRLTWIEEMWSKGLEIIVALSPRRSKKGLIEYMPIEVAPEPVKGKSSLFINCIWVLPRFKKMGIGEGLMQRARNGIPVVKRMAAWKEIESALESPV